MAYVMVRCPACGNEMQVGENTETLFCSECGKKIVREKAPVPETPAEPAPEEAPAAEKAKPAPETPAEPAAEKAEPVPEAPAEPTPKKAPAAEKAKPEKAPVPAPTGFLAQMDRLFRDRSYAEAYEGYTRYLQAHPGDIRSLYRQGICAVYLSEGTIFRTAELRSAVGASLSAMNKAGDYSLAPEKDDDLLALLVHMTAHGVTFNEKLATQEECASQTTGWVALAGLYQEATALITAEESREEAFRAGVEFCDRALGFKASYSTGVRQTSKGKTVEDYEEYTPDKKQRLALKEARRRMAASYNSLGTRTSEEARLNEDAAVTEKTIGKLKKDIRLLKEKYSASRSLFLADNLAVKAGRSKILRNSLIICGIVIVVLGVFAFFTFKKERWFLFALLLLLAAAFLYLGCRVSRRSMKQYEANQYPEELKALFDRLEDEKKQLRENKKHASFAKNAVRKFNKSKL